MLTRLEQEEPEYFENKGISREEFSLHLTQNICLPINKYHSRVFRDTTVKI